MKIGDFLFVIIVYDKIDIITIEVQYSSVVPRLLDIEDIGNY